MECGVEAFAVATIPEAVELRQGGVPSTVKILVLGVFPRRRKLDHPHRKQVMELNAALPSLLKTIPNVSFKDIGDQFLDENGFLSEEMMPDTTHPSAKGHQIWASAISENLKEMLK